MIHQKDGRRLPTVDDSTRRGLSTHRVVDDSLSGQVGQMISHYDIINKLGEGDGHRLENLRHKIPLSYDTNASQRISFIKGFDLGLGFI